jgi:hypothetical protein
VRLISFCLVLVAAYLFGANCVGPWLWPVQILPSTN